MRGWGVVSRWASAKRQGCCECSEGKGGVSAPRGMGEMTGA